MNFGYFINKAAKIHARKTQGKTFYFRLLNLNSIIGIKVTLLHFRFSVDSKLNAFKVHSKIHLPGAAHGDDLSYLL